MASGQWFWIALVILIVGAVVHGIRRDGAAPYALYGWGLFVVCIIAMFWLLGTEVFGPVKK